MRSITATDFKARCLAILDEVQRTGETIVIKKRGRPVARLIPSIAADEQYPQRTLIGTVLAADDLVRPALPAEDWDAARGEGL